MSAFVTALASGVAAAQLQRSKRIPLMDTSASRSRFQTSIVIGDTTPGVTAPSKKWYQTVLDASPSKMLNGEKRAQRESNFFITIQTNYKPRGGSEGPQVQAAFVRGLDALFYDDSNLATVFKMGVYPDKNNSNPRLDYGSDKYDSHVESGDAKIGVEWGPMSGRLHAHIHLTVIHYSRVQLDGKKIGNFMIDYMRASGKGDLPLFYKDDWYAEQNTEGLRRGRKRDQTRAIKRPDKARQMYVDIKLLPQSNLKQLMELYISKTVRQLETGATRLPGAGA
jgi:hypothetical protein